MPRFLSPGDTSRLLLEVVHATGPSGRMSLDVTANGLTLGELPSGFDLGDKAKAVFEVPVTAGTVGNQTIDVSLTTPDGKVLTKTLTVPVTELAFERIRALAPILPRFIVPVICPPKVPPSRVGNSP